MKLDYKNIFLVHIFADAVVLAILLKHDSYQIFLAIASLMIGYALAHFITRSRIIRLILFVSISVAICQISVTVKMAQMDESNPTGALVADVVHGFRRIVDLKDIPSEIKEKGPYGFFENTNYRYLTMGMFLPYMGASIMMKSLDQKKGKRLRKRQNL